jgi:hypothetical protein
MITTQTPKPVFTIERQVAGYAYARSGNAHNPTPRINWIIRDADGKIQGTYGYRRDAVDLIVNYLHGTVAKSVTNITGRM